MALIEHWRASADAAVEIARAAGRMLAGRLWEAHTVDFKSSADDIVTEMDRKVEAYVVGELRRRFPAHAIRAEEGTASDEAQGAALRWHIDPLDGTSNYFHGLPWFSVSLGLEDREGPPGRQLVAGVVYHVMADEMFRAVLDDGATRNGQPIRVSSRSSLPHALIATGFPYWVKRQPRTVMENIARVRGECRDLRRMGAASIDLAYVACGRFEAYFEEGLQTWDTCAGALLVREAGGSVTDYDGEAVAIPSTHVLASNGVLHAPLVDLLRGRYRKIEV